MSADEAAAPGADPLVNRVLKNARHLARWAKRDGIEAYRLYERDIPEYPYAIDRYGEWLDVQLFEGRRPLAETAIMDHLDALAVALALPRAQVMLKVRRRQRGTAQYEKLAAAGRAFVVHEYGLKFEVDLDRYLDTGLFLDHRTTRRMVGGAAADRRMLNLFAYTGSFSVHAAAGGARTTTTVDMSHTYTAWSARNLALNGFTDSARHRLVAADVLRYLDDTARTREQFDLIVLDPPSFSNSKRMQDSFDVQRDQVQLLRATLRLLAPGGVLYFSNNRQGFRLDPMLRELADFEDITARTIPEDFTRTRPHLCWRVQQQ